MLEKEPKKRPSTGEVTQLMRLMGSAQSREQDTVIAPRKRRSHKARVDPSSSAPTLWIRPTADRQPMTVQNRQRLWGLGAVLLFAVGWLSFSAIRSAYQSRPQAPPAAAAAAAAEVATTAKENAAAPVRVSIKSVPSGAVVIDLEGEKKLGVTPFSASMDAGDKDLWLVLRKDGFSERVVRVSLRHSSEWSEKLAPESGAVQKSAARQTLEEVKKKYESSTRSSKSDVLKPRIVD